MRQSKMGPVEVSNAMTFTVDEQLLRMADGANGDPILVARNGTVYELRAVTKAKATRKNKMTKRKKSTRAKRNIPRKLTGLKRVPVTSKVKRRYKRVTDPVTLEHRRAALVRARQALAEKRAAKNGTVNAPQPEAQPTEELVPVS